MTLALFDDLPKLTFDGPDGPISYRTAGTGPPLLLLHGYPQSGMMWADCLPQLARTFSCVVPDLRGYGDSFKPEPQDNHQQMSFRAMAADQAALMAALGFNRYGVVGHDRGARTAHRFALDHADHVTALALLDITPTLHFYETIDQRSASAYFHWFLLPQPAPLPELLISGKEDDWISSRLDRWSLGGAEGTAGFFTAEHRARYAAFLRDPTCLRASNDDYRAGATIDLEHDRVSRAAGEKINCDTLVLWGSKGLFADKDMLGLWRDHCASGVRVEGTAAPTGHFIPEEAPNFVCEKLHAFFLSAGGACRN